MKVLVYGLGRSGTAVAHLLRRQGHEVCYFDAHIPFADGLESLGCKPCAAVHDCDAELCIAAPGVPYNHPDLQMLRQRMETIGEVEWVHRSVPSAPIIGITGTAGKTSTSQWLYDILHSSGAQVALGGNIDPALSAVAHDGTLLVTELSSFQLERCPTLSPRTAIILNLGVDHLDRHGSVAGYHAAKRQLLANLAPDALFIYNHDDPIVNAWAHAHTGRTQSFSLRSPADAWLHADGQLCLHGEPLLHRADLRVQGEHMLANALAVSLAAAEHGVSRQTIAAGLRAFSGVTGRYNRIRTLRGVHFIEDSIATRSLAVEAALRATPAPIVWLLGGQDKGADIASLRPLVAEKVSLAIGFGQAGADFVAAIADLTETNLCQAEDGMATMQCCCHHGFQHLQEGGGTVLLAPLGASFDQFANYRARANAFRRAVETLSDG